MSEHAGEDLVGIEHEALDRLRRAGRHGKRRVEHRRTCCRSGSRSVEAADQARHPGHLNACDDDAPTVASAFRCLTDGGVLRRLVALLDAPRRGRRPRGLPHFDRETMHAWRAWRALVTPPGVAPRPVRVRVDLNHCGGWDIVFPGRRDRVTCETLDEARRVAYLCAAHRHSCELVVRDADHSVMHREFIDGDDEAASARSRG